MIKSQILAVAIVAVALAGCEQSKPLAVGARPVRTITVERRAEGETVSLTGQVKAKDEVSLAFRLDGRMIERLVNVGDVVTAGQVIARLDAQNQQNALRTAQANLAAAEAQLTQARLTFERQQELKKNGWTPQAKFDEAQQSFLVAQAQVDSAHAQLRTAQDQLSYTVVSADAPGAVTAVGTEPGEVVRAGQMIVQLARKGGRDAVFDVPEELIRTGPRDPLIEIALTNDPKVKATGRVREVAPQADAATRTFQVKVGITDPPDEMRLGSTIIGRIKLPAPAGVVVPASALTQANGNPAVWIVDPQSETVSPRKVDVLRYDPAYVVVSQGLESGEIVVTAGVQSLHPGQKVRLLGAAS
ncbi:MAG: efflux RND transporter periplasmic adaptor subunit [Methylobacteriaceae bacterium]|nr:efflux RND transporter periplasmic adaptor subunit [Methylobacteriaceae bacterium]